MTREPWISVTIPIYNEEDNIPRLYASVRESLEKIGKPWELILVNDGSRDGSAGIDPARCPPLPIPNRNRSAETG